MADRKTTHPKTQEEAERLLVQAKLADGLSIITEEQAAILLQVSMMQLRRLRERHALPVLRVGNSTIRYEKEALFSALRVLKL